MSVGENVKRVDAFDKVTGFAKYTDDLADKSALIARVLHSTIANGIVKSIDTSEAEKIEGVVKIVTCFDVPDLPFATAGHPWSTDPAHQDTQDRHMLNQRVRYYGDDIAAVVAENEIAAAQALRAIKVEYEEYPFVLDPIEAVQDGAPVIHDEFDHNILKHTDRGHGDMEKSKSEEGLVLVDGWYETPTVQHCHIENPITYAEMDRGRIVITTSTQIPHIVRRVVGQALGIPWGKVRVIKPYIGGGFGNKQDVLYEPLCAYLCTKVGGRLVKMDIPREETFVSTRVRHAEKIHIQSWMRKDGTCAAREVTLYSNQGAYASHGHSIAAKGITGIEQVYKADAYHADAYTVYTNRPAAGAMRGYGVPQITFAIEAHMDDIAQKLGIEPYRLREINKLDVGYYNPFYQYYNYVDSIGMMMEKGKEYIDYDRKVKEYANQTGNIRRGIGMGVSWYTTAVWPISLESCSCRMVMNQDGSIQLQMAETEIGQGADTAFAQMAADVVGLPVEDVHVVSTQDTDVTPFGTGAYASRQTYIASMGIKKTGDILKGKILAVAERLTRFPAANLDVKDGKIVHKVTGQVFMTVGELATASLYTMGASEHLTAESTYEIKTNALSFGCCFAEVEVDIRLCKVKILNIINLHDCGNLINPKLAEAQVEGGMSMAIGYALSEQLLFDPKTGKVLNGNLLDYKLSTMMDHPHLEAQFVENPEPTSVFGTKALGEPPACVPAPAIRNAILNATGVAFNKIPITPHLMFEEFSKAGLI